MKLFVNKCLTCLALVTGAASFCAFGYGEPDPSFQPTTMPGWECDNYTIATLADGSAFLTGMKVNTSQPRTGIMKFTAAGAPDSTWGAGGIADTSDLYSRKVFVPAADNGLYVIGSGVTRYLKDGSVDPSWISGSEQSFAYVLSAARSADGGLTILGQRFVGTNYTTVLEKFDVNGQLVGPPFNPGSATVYGWSVDSQGQAEVATYYAVDNSGAIIPRLDRYTSAPSDQLLSPARLIPGPGVASWLSPDVGVDPAGGVIFFRVNPVDQSMSLIRYGPDGLRDFAFAAGGSASIPMMAFAVPGAASVTPKALWRSPNGSWTVVTTIAQFGGGLGIAPQLFQGNVALRFLADGTPDPNFTQFAPLAYPYQYARLDTGQLLRSNFNSQACGLARDLTDDVRLEATMVEYFHPVLQHYFMTLEGAEAAGLDDNVATLGWVRTGRTFGALPAAGVPGTVPGCRFYGDPVIGPNSHFYSTEQGECDELRSLELSTPPGVPVWHLEGYTFSASNLKPDGTCVSNLAPVYRVFSGPVTNSAGSNHRYTTDVAVYDQMIDMGWLAEGARFCVPPRPSRTSK